MKKVAVCTRFYLATAVFLYKSGFKSVFRMSFLSSLVFEKVITTELSGILTIKSFLCMQHARTNTMAIYQLDDLKPTLHPSAWVADSAQVIGQVTLAENSSVWFGVVIRGDTSTIHIGTGSNIQDNSVLHADVGVPLVIGDNVSVGHQVMLHGCTIGDNSLIGIGAIVLNHAKIGRYCLVGAGALVTEGKEFPDGSMIIGSPAKAVRMLSPEQMDGLKMVSRHYVDNAKRYKDGLKKLA